MTNTAVSVESPIATLFPELDNEIAKTRRILERFPADKADWTPHAKSRSIAALASHIAVLPLHGARIIETGSSILRTARSPRSRRRPPIC